MAVSEEPMDLNGLENVEHPTGGGGLTFLGLGIERKV
jgi:hypothetical protein